MKRTHHIICLTIDTDPDGLSGITTDRAASSFKGLEYLQTFPSQLNENLKKEIPLTWFVRIDKQMEDFFGNELYLLEKFSSFWQQVKELNHEMAWHPHIYQKQDSAFIISSDEKYNENCVLKSWQLIQQNKVEFISFRNGEGWQTPALLNTIEQLGMRNDSTAIPNLNKPAPHPMNWINAPTQPYFPSQLDVRNSGAPRAVLEIPMNTWQVKAPYDAAPKTRYMNAAVRTELFENSLSLINVNDIKADMYIWNFITHPDELMPERKSDLLYSGSVNDYIKNIEQFVHKINATNCTYEFATIAAAGGKWRQHYKTIR